MQRTESLGLLAVACLFLTACASAGVEHADSNLSEHYPRPRVIFCGGADVSGGEWKNAAADKSNDWRGKVHGWFAKLEPKELSRIAPVEPEANARHDGWLVRTSVTYFDPGSATARLWLGGGAGQSKIRTQIEVYDLRSTSSPILSFSTYGDSGSYSSLYEQVTVGTGPEKDIWRTCREIRDHLQDAISVKNQ